MIISSEVLLKELAIHRITSGGLHQSKRSIQVQDEDLNQLLVKYFFRSFKPDERFQFAHSSALDLNVVFQCVAQIFEDSSRLFDLSVDIAKHLTSQSQPAGQADVPNAATQPQRIAQQVREGADFFVVLFEDCVLDDEVTDGVGIFKIENKETYLKIMDQQEDFDIQSAQGIPINKLDKGAIIFNTDKESGFQVILVDNTSKSGDTGYWKDDFLSLKPLENAYYHTQNLIQNVQEFAHEAFPDEDKTDKIAFVNESIQYMKSKDEFEQADFQATVLKSPELIDRFEHFQEKVLEEDPEQKTDHFSISKSAVKNTKRHIRSVIKLDKNFHVYVHGNRENIQRGFDPDKKKNFYTLYFDDET